MIWLHCCNMSFYTSLISSSLGLIANSIINCSCLCFFLVCELSIKIDSRNFKFSKNVSKNLISSQHRWKKVTWRAYMSMCNQIRLRFFILSGSWQSSKSCVKISSFDHPTNKFRSIQSETVGVDNVTFADLVIA